MGCDVHIRGSQPDIELQKLACTIRTGQTDFTRFIPESEHISDKTRYVDLRWIEAGSGGGFSSFERKQEISEYYDGRITGVGKGLWEGMWFDNLNGGRIVSGADADGIMERKLDTLYLTPEEGVRVGTGDVSHFIEAFIIRQRCIPNLLLSDDYYYSNSLYYFYCVCGGKKRVATAKPEHLHNIKQDIISILQALNDNYEKLGYYSNSYLPYLDQEFLYGDYVPYTIDKSHEDLDGVLCQEKNLGHKQKYDYTKRLFRRKLEEHYQSLSKLDATEKRLIPIYDLLLPMNIELHLIRERKIHTVGDLLENYDFDFEFFLHVIDIDFTNEETIQKTIVDFKEYELKIQKGIFGVDLRRGIDLNSLYIDPQYIKKILTMCNILKKIEVF